MTGAYVWVKHENHQPIGAFKVRGGVSLVSQLTDDERRRGVITASTGNHGQSVAYAADLFGVHAIICVPEQANPVKVESMRALGAEVVFHGRDFDEAREYCEKQATEHGYRYIHSGNEPLLIAGVATYTLEVLEARPDIEVIVVPTILTLGRILGRFLQVQFQSIQSADRVEAAPRFAETETQLPVVRDRPLKVVDEELRSERRDTRLGEVGHGVTVLLPPRP